MTTTRAARICTEHCAEFEGFCPFPYPDPASPLARATPRIRWGFVPAASVLATLSPQLRALSGAPWTQGYGDTHGVKPTNPEWSQSVARANLEARLDDLIQIVRTKALRPLTDGQAAALAAFLDNVGPGGPNKDGLFRLRSGRPSTLWRCVLAGDDAKAALEFGKWNKAQGRVMAGLTRRRASETAMYRGL